MTGNATDSVLTPAVAIIGGGPSGLRAARELASRVDGDVVVIERERTAGGIPRHANHPGYGMRDLGRFMTGPHYARRLVRDAEQAGARILTEHDATGWADDTGLELTSPQGRRVLRPGALVLATGARERPRPARLIPGDRGAGVYTTGQLQQQVHLKHQKVGKHAVIIGAELVSWSAALTLQEAGCRTELLVTKYPQADSYRMFDKPGRLLFRTKVAVASRVVSIEGSPRVEAVIVENLITGRRWRVDCDTVVFTGDWIPDNELARMADLTIDAASLAPEVDGSLRTSRPGVFAIGNLVHPVTTADLAALDGRHVVDAVVGHLNGEHPAPGAYSLVAEAPLRWISPSSIRPGDPAPSRDRLVSWTDELIPSPVVTATQAGREIGHARTPWPAAPGRAFLIPAEILRHAQSAEGDVVISVR